MVCFLILKIGTYPSSNMIERESEPRKLFYLENLNLKNACYPFSKFLYVKIVRSIFSLNLDCKLLEAVKTTAQYLLKESTYDGLVME